MGHLTAAWARQIIRPDHDAELRRGEFTELRTQYGFPSMVMEKGTKRRQGYCRTLLVQLPSVRGGLGQGKIANRGGESDDGTKDRNLDEEVG